MYVYTCSSNPILCISWKKGKHSLCHQLFSCISAYDLTCSSRPDERNRHILGMARGRIRMAAATLLQQQGGQRAREDRMIRRLARVRTLTSSKNNPAEPSICSALGTFAFGARQGRTTASDQIAGQLLG